jgi:hypothetical protein
VHDSHDLHGISTEPVDHPIRKSKHSTLPDSRFDFPKEERVGPDPPDRFMNRFPEMTAETDLLVFIVEG